MFTGVAVELDAGNRIFTTLPVVPVDRTGGTNKAATLDFATPLRLKPLLYKAFFLGSLSAGAASMAEWAASTRQ